MKFRITVLIIVSVVASIILYSMNIYKLRTRNTVEQLVQEKKIVNILVAGSNTYNDRKHRFYALVTINPENNNIGITYIPPEYRILGEDEDDAPTALKDVELDNFDRIRKTLYADIKLDIPFYVELYSLDVKRIVDLVEGVELFVLNRVNSMKGEKTGVYYFDGQRIMDYINETKEDSIYLKYDRVQDVLFTLYYNRLKIKKFNSIPFITEVFKKIKTNLLPQEIFQIGEMVMAPGSCYSILLPAKFENDLFATDEISYKMYEQDLLQRVIMNEDVDVAPKIKILNGTNVSGLARRMRNRLIRDGLVVVEFGTSQFDIMDESIIISRKGDYEAVKKVADITGIKKIYHIIDNTVLHNVLIILGRDKAR